MFWPVSNCLLLASGALCHTEGVRFSGPYPCDSDSGFHRIGPLRGGRTANPPSLPFPFLPFFSAAPRPGAFLKNPGLLLSRPSSDWGPACRLSRPLFFGGPHSLLCASMGLLINILGSWVSASCAVSGVCVVAGGVTRKAPPSSPPSRDVVCTAPPVLRPQDPTPKGPIGPVPAQALVGCVKEILNPTPKS